MVEDVYPNYEFLFEKCLQVFSESILSARYQVTRFPTMNVIFSLYNL